MFGNGFTVRKIARSASGGRTLAKRPHTKKRRPRELHRLGAFLLAAGVLVPLPALAWGDEGHRIIALVAYRHLTPATRGQVDQMLREDDDTLTEPDMASRATWADKFRDSDRHTSQQQYRLTRAWHFVDIELDQPDLGAACFGHPAAAVPASIGPARACVVDRIEAFAAELRDLPHGAPERSVAFKFVLHLVGDVHQPLHAADNQDSGGNGLLVLTGQRAIGQPLHAYWDTDVVKRLGKDPMQVTAAIEQRFGAGCGDWMQGTPSDWAMESFALARDVVYQLDEPTTDERDQPVFRLSSSYQRAAIAVAAEQLEKAGCRLAMVLNQALR